MRIIWLWALILAIGYSAYNQTMSTLSTENSLSTENGGFKIGAPIPIQGLEGESVIASEDRIVTLSSSVVMWYEDSTLYKVALPNIPVKHAQWSVDGSKIFVGTGAINMKKRQWEPHPTLTSLVKSRPPGMGGPTIKATSWSRDGQLVAVIMAWSGPQDQATEPSKILLFDILSGAPPITLPVEEVDDVQIAGNHVVVLAPEVSIWSFSGEVVAKLPSTNLAPASVSSFTENGYLALIDHDWSVRIIDTNNWSIKATWKGYFRDIVSTASGVIALDLDGNLHAACLTDKGVRAIGKASTRLLVSKLAAYDDSHLIIMGVGHVAIHSISYQLNCDD